MQDTKAAIAAKLTGDAWLTAQLAAGSIRYGWPQQVPASELITFLQFSSTRDAAVPVWTELFQVDVWAQSSDRAGALAEQVVALLDHGALTVDNATFQECLLEADAELYEADTRLHHRSLRFRVALSKALTPR
jgi:hypothetical protein